MNKPFSNQSSVLVTRPEHQADALCQMITDRGGNPISFPTIAIDPPNNFDLVIEGIERLEHAKMAIFLSANTLRYCVEYLSQKWREIEASSSSHPVSHIPQIAVIGKGTQKAIIKAGLPVDLIPKVRFNSEGLLALPELQQDAVADQKIVIFSGEGGRTLLADTLKKRGALLSKIVTYRRMQPQCDPHPILDLLQRGAIHWVVCTSNESLRNLFAMLPANGQTMLIETQLVGVSERLRPLAKMLGFKKNVIVAGNATDQAIVDAIGSLPQTE